MMKGWFFGVDWIYAVRMRIGIAVLMMGVALRSSLVGQTVVPVPDAAGVYRAGKGVAAPKVVSQVEPEYSEAARKKKISGSCRMDVVIDPSGRVGEVRITHSIAENQPAKLRKAAESLDEKAMEAVRKYRFDPGTVDGKPVAVRTTMEISFQVY